MSAPPGQRKTVVCPPHGAERLTQGPYTAIRRTITLADLTLIDTGGAGGHVLYPVTDNLGSTIALGAANGSLAQGMSYGPFGRRETAGWAGYMSQSEALTINTTETDRSYTGQEGLDAVGLMDYNARLYDPSLGRFLSVDPKIADPQGTQSINPYSYVGNNPLNATDPTGESKCVAGRPCSDPLAGQFDGLMAINVSDATVSGSIMQNGVAIASFSVSGEAAVGMLADMVGTKTMDAGVTLTNDTNKPSGGNDTAGQASKPANASGDPSDEYAYPNSMSVSKKYQDMMKAHETSSHSNNPDLVPYVDQAGNWTVGFGHKIKIGEHIPAKINSDGQVAITKKTAQSLWGQDLSRAESAVRSLVKVRVSPGQFAALSDFVLNAGPGNLKGSTILKALNKGDYVGASSALELYNAYHIGKKVYFSDGLLNRRRFEERLFMGEPN